MAQNIKGDSKSFFAYARSKAKSTVRAGILLNNDGVKTDSVDDVAEEFNKYFASVFTAENVNKIPEPQGTYGRPELDVGVLSDCQFTLDDVKKKLSKLRQDKSTGADDISPRLLYNIQEDICEPLYLLFRKLLDDGMVPDDWRNANVSPLYKNGCRTNVGNYRPVSLTSQICKLFESLIRDDLVNHLEQNLAIADSQHGFRKGRSYLTNLLTFLEQVTGLIDNGDSADVTYILGLHKSF